MKSFTVVAALSLALASSATAQSQCASVASAIPACGQSCLLSAGSAIGCAATDYACQCTSSSALQNSAQNCVISSCGINTALSVQASASAVCSCVATATPASSAAAAAASTSAAAPASSAPTASAAPTSAAPSSAPAASSPAESAAPSTLATVASPPAGSCVSVTVTKTVYYTAPATAPASPVAGCKGKTGTEYLICCVNKIFTSGD